MKQGPNKTSMRRRRPIIPYNPVLKERARELRNNSTRSEVLLWLYLKGRQMLGFDFDRQRPIDNYIVDFYCKDLRLAIEIDGPWHELQKEYDEQRDARLAELGVCVFRISDDDVRYEPDRVLESIRDAVRRRVNELGVGMNG